MSDWVENAEEEVFTEEFSNGSAAAEKLLEISPTNRTIAGREQAVTLATLRFAESYYETLYPEKGKYRWIGNLCNIIESYQLTLDGEQNSRRQFIRVLSAQLMAELHKYGKGDTINQITK